MSNTKKFRNIAVSSMVATAAVAAVAPVVSADSINFSDVQKGDSHYDGIMALAEQGIVAGYEDGSFGVYDNVTRQQVAVMLANALDLGTPSDIDSVLSAYDDVDADSLYAEQIAAVTEAGAFTGNNGKFNPSKEISREQMASVLVSGLGLEDYVSGDDVDVNLDNVSQSHADNVQVLANLGLTVALDNFRPSEEISRGAFATMLHGALNVEQPAALEIEKVNAAGNNDLTATINGSVTSADKVTISLDEENVIEADLDDEGNFTFTTDKLKQGEYTATVVAHQGEETVEKTVDFTVGLEVNTVTATTLAVDEDTDEQFLEFAINESDKNIDVATLVENGYNVEFQSTNTDVLANKSTGELNQSELSDVDQFEYKVVVTKDDVTIESDLTEVNVESYASSVTSISDYDLLFDTNVVNKGGVISVTDENVSLNNFDVTYKNGDEAEINGTNSQVDFSSSDESVALIDEDGNITPVSAGQVTFTIEAGNVEEQVTVTVSDEEREATSAELSKETIGLVSSAEDTFELTVTDQFGDAVKGFDKDIANVKNSDDEQILAVTNGPDTDSTDAEGKTTVTVKADETNEGTGVLEVTNAAGDVLGTIDVTVDADTEVASRQLELASDAADTTLDLNPLDTDKEVTLALNEYNASGLKIGGYDFSSGDYTVESSNTDVITADSENGKIHVTAESEGTAKVLVKEGSVVRYEMDITVEDTTPSVSNVSFQENIEITSAGTLNLEDDILDNVSLTSEGTVAYEVDNGDVVAYIDVDDDDDITLGTIDVLSNDFDNAQFVNGSDNIELAKNDDDEGESTFTGFESSDEGTVVVRFTAEGETNAKAARSIHVNVE
ncbi:S-layer homology domain-containing protein [Lentibacillus cibarius]|nr:S-layer homology domain-containing protein [Lentibacillus cibarius]